MTSFRITIILLILCGSAGLSIGQDLTPDTSQKDVDLPADVQQRTPQNSDFEFVEGLFYEFSAFGGAGVAEQSDATHGSLHFGIDMRMYTPPVPLGMLFEAGYVGPINSFESGSAIISTNLLQSLVLGKNNRLLVFGTGGYTRLFGTGNAINFGAGIGFKISKGSAMNIEVRDYLELSDPKAHNVAIRIGFAAYSPPM